MIYFFNKIDVPGLSAGNVTKIFNAGFDNVKKVFDASVDDLLKVEGFKIKMAEKISEALKERKAIEKSDTGLT